MTRGDSAARALGPAEHVEHDPALATRDLPPFEAIYQTYFDFVWASARRLGVSTAAIDDVVQEVFMVIHSKLHTLRDPRALRSWIYGVARRTVSDHRRSQRTKEASGALLTAHAELEQGMQPTPQDLSEQSDQVKLLYDLLAELDGPKREVFILAELEEMSVPEIAAALEIPLNTAYSRLRTARQAFEERLARRSARQRPEGRS